MGIYRIHNSANGARSTATVFSVVVITSALPSSVTSVIDSPGLPCGPDGPRSPCLPRLATSDKKLPTAIRRRAGAGIISHGNKCAAIESDDIQGRIGFGLCIKTAHERRAAILAVLTGRSRLAVSSIGPRRSDRSCFARWPALAIFNGSKALPHFVLIFSH